MLTSSRRTALLAAAGALLAPAAAQATTTSHPTVTYPTVTGVSPLTITIGQQLTITGRHFRPGKNATTVVFGRAGNPPVYVKASSATSTRLSVTVPTKLAAFLAQSKGQRLATHFALRVIASRTSERWTSSKLSPLVKPGPALAAVAPPAADAGAPAVVDPYLLCEQAAAAAPGGDPDGDGLASGLELSVRLDPCLADTDGDGVPDGYEYESAKDLGGQNVPYPGKRPFPNPLDGSDADFDFDGDGLSMAQEFRIWKFLGSPFTPGGQLAVSSDGTQNTGGPVAVTTPAQAQLDLSGDGNLTDDERDADGDGLSNVVELNYSGTQAWWDAAYTEEKPYTLRPFADLDPTDVDSNGNGIADGADDQDQDGYSNVQEMQLGRRRTGLRVQPFNPCLPDPYALTCSRYVPFSNAWAPFDATQRPGDGVPFLWPRPTPTGSETTPWNGRGGAQG